MAEKPAIPVSATTGLPGHWRAPLLAWALVLAAVVGLHAHTLVVMAGTWARSDTYAHGFVVPLITLWLVWRIRGQLAGLLPRPSPSAWLLLAGASALWFAGDLVAVNAATQLALVAMVVLSVPSVLGWHTARAMAFPLGFLFFAVPIGDFMLPQLIEWTADFTVLALRVTGIPVYREGLQFVIPSGSWSVVEACSGIRYLIAAVTVGSLFAYLSYRSLRKRLVFVAVSVAVPLVANWVRAYLIVMLGHLSGNELATGVDHLIYGWVFFGVVILIMLLIGARWADAPGPIGRAPASDAAFAGSSGQTRPASRRFVTALCVMLMVLLAPHGLERVLRWSNLVGPVALQAPQPQAPWRSAQPDLTWQPAFKLASATRAMGYENTRGQRVTLHLSYYREQDYQRKLVSSENVLVVSDDEKWARVSTGVARTRLGTQALTVASASLREVGDGLAASGNQRIAVWRFYWVNDRLLAGDAMAKIQGALGRLRGWGDDGAIVVLHTPLEARTTPQESERQAHEVLDSWMQANGEALLGALRQARGGR